MTKIYLTGPHTYTYTYTCTYTYTYTYPYRHTYTYTYTYSNTDIHTHIHIQTHTHTLVHCAKRLHFAKYRQFRKLYCKIFNARIGFGTVLLSCKVFGVC